MSYKVTKADGKSVIVQDYAKEIVGGLTLLGYGFANFGDELAQNFVKGLENNAGLAEPVNPVLGQFWFQVPSDQANNPKNLRVCINTSGGTLDDRWKILFAITPTGAINLDAYTLRGAAPAVAAGTPGAVVVRDANGRIDPSNINFPATPGTIDASNRLTNTRVFGSRNGGLPFDGTQNVALNTSHIAEADQQYFTTARARAAISATGSISYDQNTGVISYTAGPAGGVTHVNGRAGDVTLNGTDVVNALGYTPYNQNGGLVNGAVQIMDTNYSMFVSGGNPILNWNQNCYMVYNRQTGDISMVVNGQNVFTVGLANGALTHNNTAIWSGAQQGAGTGMDSDLLDGQHGDFYRNLANSYGSLPSSAIFSAATLSGENGYCVFSNGLVHQWGRLRQSFRSEYTAYISFPIAMAETMNVSVTPALDFYRNQADLWYQIVGGFDSGGFTIGTQSDDGKDMASEGCYWFATGRLN